MNNALRNLLIKSKVTRIPAINNVYHYLRDKPLLVDSVAIDTCAACVSRCVYCLHQKNHMTKPEMIDYELFTDIADLLAKENFRIVYLYQSGEPFLHPRIYDMITNVATLDMDSSIATRLNAKMDFGALAYALLDASVYKHTVEILVTIDSFNNPKEISPGINRELVISNLAELAKLQKYKSAKFLFSSVVTKANENELESIGEKIKSFGFENYSPTSMCYYMWDIAPKQDLETIKEFIPTDAKYRNRFDIVNGEVIAPQTYCNNIMPTIGVDGHVTICCHDMLHRIDMGDVVKRGSLRRIISSPDYVWAVRLGRKFKLAICRGCN